MLIEKTLTVAFCLSYKKEVKENGRARRMQSLVPKDNQ